jgi:molecular chaperone DnaK
VSTPDVPLVRIQLRYPDESVFLNRFAPNVTRGGIFLTSRAPHPVGLVIAFEVALVQGPPLLWGTGKVTWVRDYDPQEPQRAHGMGVQFLQVDPGARPMLEKLLNYKNLPQRFTPAAGVPSTMPRPALPRTGSSDTPPGEGDPAIWIDDQGMRKAIDRARILARGVDDVEVLRKREREEPPTLEAALAQLPRLLTTKR